MNRAVKFILIISLFFTSKNAIVAQTIDERVIEALGRSQSEIIQQNSPHYLEYLNYFLDNSYFVTDLPAGKPYTDISSVQPKFDNLPPASIELNNLRSFNVLQYEFQRKFKERTFYKIGSTGKMLVFYSEQEFVKSFNRLKQ